MQFGGTRREEATGTIESEPGDGRGWSAGWADVTVTPDEDLMVVDVDGRAIATLPGRSARVLDDLQQLLCTETGRLRDLVDELRSAGYPESLDLEAHVSSTAAALEATGLVRCDSRPASDPKPPPAFSALPDRFGQVPHAVAAVRPLAHLEVSRPFDERLVPRLRRTETRTGTIAVRADHSTSHVRIGTDSDDVAAWLAGLASYEAGPVEWIEVHAVRLPGSVSGGTVVANGTCTYAVDAEALRRTTAAAIARLAGVEPADAVRVPDCWVENTSSGDRLTPDSPASVIPESSAWCGPLWVTGDGRSLVTLAGADIARQMAVGIDRILACNDSSMWEVTPLNALEVPTMDETPAVLAAIASDLLRHRNGGRDHPILRVAARLATNDRIAERPPRPQAPPELEIPPSVTELATAGTLTAQARSTKVVPGRLVTARASWSLHIDESTDPDRREELARRLAGFALPDVAAEVAVGRPGTTRRFVIGVESGLDQVAMRHKVYLDIDCDDTWAAVLDHWPELDELHRASVLSRGDPPQSPPRFVAWKRGKVDRTEMSLYRRDHARGVTVADAIALVLPGQREWRDAATMLVGLDRDLDAELTDEDLEVIDPHGRSSIDLGVDSFSPRGHRIAPARWLAALAGIDDHHADSWANGLARDVVFRVIVGTDAAGGPFVSFYTV